MGRSVSRFAVVTLLDLQRFSCSFDELADLIHHGVEPKISGNTLENLVKRAIQSPQRRTLETLYGALDAALKSRGIHSIAEDERDASIENDLATRSSATAWTVEALRRDMTALLQSARRDEEPLFESLWKALRSYVIYEEVDDQLCMDGGNSGNPDEQTIGKRGIDARRADLLETGVKAMDVALARLERLSEEVQWPTPARTVEPFGTLRLHIQAERLCTMVMSIPPNERFGNGQLKVAWDSAAPLDLWRHADPAGRSFKFLRNFLELAQYCGRPLHVLNVWDLIQSQDPSYRGEENHATRGPMPKALVATTAAVRHGPAIADDPHLQAATEYILAYETWIKQRVEEWRRPSLKDHRQFREACRIAFASQHPGSWKERE